MDYSLWRLRLTMLGTLALVIGASTLFLAVVLTYLGGFDIVTMLVLVVAFSLVQWLVGPYMISAMYRVREVPDNQLTDVHGMLQSICMKAGLKVPKLMLSPTPAPNAFAYGSPLTGSRVCVTQGLLNTLEPGEVEAVLGHELGHLKHRDVQIMMFVSVLPTIFYYIGWSMMWGGSYGNSRSNNGGSAAAVGALALAAYFILNLLVLGLSRERELYADRHGAEVVDDGADKLSSALAKLDMYGRRGSSRTAPSGQAMGFHSLLIVDPDTAGRSAVQYAYSDRDLIEQVANRRISESEKIFEVFSTHPNIVKRIRILQAMKLAAR
ncbi:MAG TPA: zinc metalloprotease HtpX [Conexivisphaerales archaeon]|nr:zinc metalloprotease HtpX [Conexivisphaerales archaeon]